MNKSDLGKKDEAVCTEDNRVRGYIAADEDLRCDRIPTCEGWYLGRSKLP